MRPPGRLFCTHKPASLAPLRVPQAYGPAAFTVGLSGGQRKQLAAWLSFCAAWVFAMVCIGGATRLTRSGLSMTDWKFTGEHRPQNEVGGCGVVAVVGCGIEVGS